jgi:hypothetical protein
MDNQEKQILNQKKSFLNNHNNHLEINSQNV